VAQDGAAEAAGGNRLAHEPGVAARAGLGVGVAARGRGGLRAGAEELVAPLVGVVGAEPAAAGEEVAGTEPVAGTAGVVQLGPEQIGGRRVGHAGAPSGGVLARALLGGPLVEPQDGAGQVVPER